MVRTSNSKARQYVEELLPFKGSNTFSEDNGDLYIVYSYGYHFPMFVYSRYEDLWFENSGKYSSSTSKQQWQLRPGVETIKLGTKELKEIINNG